MEYWEFLLQKEGDRTWLPLESAEVEILEGRYRLMAHGAQADAVVEVRISQLLLEEMPPKRRVLKRQGQTNQDGLMVVMPFTQLHPGTWEIRCLGGDPLDDLMGDSWQYGVQFQVSPQSSDETDDWDANWSPVADQETVSADRIAVSSLSEVILNVSGASPNLNSLPTSQLAQSESETETETETETSVIAVSSDLDIMADRLMGDVFSDMLSPPGSDVESDTESDTEVKNLTPQIAATASAFPLQISLDQTTYLVRARQPLLLQIQICSEQRLYAELPESELTLVLRNPQTSELLATLKRSLLSQSLPAQIEVEAKLPAAVKTYLILGELTLQSLDEPLILAAQAFTVAAMLDELIETVADQGEYLQDPTQWHLPLEGTAAQVADAMGQVVRKTMPVQLPSSVRPDKPAFLPSTGMFLPPQIHNSLLAPPSASNRSPVLPSLPPITQADSSLSTAASDTAAAIDIAAPEADLPLTAAPEAALSPDENRSEPALAAPPEALTVDQADEDADFIAATQQNDFEAKTFLELKIADTATAPLEDSEVDVAFQSLNLKDRFWSRLSAFALDGYKAAQEIQAATELGEMIANQAETAVPNETIAPIMSLGEKDFSREFVVYDAAAQTVQLEDQPPPESRAAADAAVELPPVPIPKLKVPVGTLIAGELISIEVTLRATPERLCVKFWTSDLQTRALVDNPRWLMSFDPDGQGNMSTTLRLTVPQGCLEARFAAIAVDIVSQRESERVVIDRSILPDALPEQPLDEFDLL